MLHDREDTDDTRGLTEASTDDLRQLAEAVASGQLAMPVSLASLGHAGFGHLSGMMTPFLGLHAAPFLGVLRAVLAERRRTAGKSLDLVWSGSDSGPSYARYTRIVVPELIARAGQQITIAGYSFDQGAGVFDHIREAMVERDVQVRMFLDIHQLGQRLVQQLKREKKRSRLQPLEKARATSAEAYAQEVLSLFRELHWPFSEPPPTLYYDPRTADSRSFASLHAKCLIVDYEHVLITSANFTGRAQNRNIEVGIVVHDRGYASALEQQWNNLVASGDVVMG